MKTGPKPIDYSGKKFNRLIAVKFSHSKNLRRYYIFKCTCGKKTTTRIDQVVSGHTRSCGCLLKERKPTNLIHGLRRAPEYNSWSGMIKRCSDKLDSRYGGRGIKVCKRWKKFTNFISDIGRKPSKIHSLGRINNNGDYKPSNCRWETPKQQANNRRKPTIVRIHPNSLKNLWFNH